MSKENEQIKELQGRVHNLEQALMALMYELEDDLPSNASYSLTSDKLSDSSNIDMSLGMIDIEEGK